MQDIDNLDWKTALALAFSRYFVIVPGTSKICATILGGLHLVAEGCVAAESHASSWQFLLWPEPLALRLVRYFMKWQTPSLPPEAIILGVGCLVAFIVIALLWSVRLWLCPQA